jgi:hypothetical protein
VACLPADRREHQWQCYLAQHYFQFCATLAVMRDEKPSVNADAKFGIGELLYNRNTKEDGRVTRVYEFEGSVMYEVSVPAIPIWANHYSSDWPESALELSKHVNPRPSDKLPMDADLEMKTGRQIAALTFAIAPGHILEWINNLETETSTGLPNELRTNLVLETDYFAFYYLRKRFSNFLDSETNDRVFSKAIDILAFLLSSVYFRAGDGAKELEARLKVTLREFLAERTKIYASLKPTFFECIARRTPTIANVFAGFVHHWVFSKLNLSKKIAGRFAEDMANRIYVLDPPEMIREAENGFD